MTATEMYFVAVLNAIILAAGGQLVISRTYLDGQPLREVMVENRPARISQDGTISEARLVLSLGRTDSEVAEGSGGASAMLWVPPQ
jgi:hypothetical protein